MEGTFVHTKTLSRPVSIHSPLQQTFETLPRKFLRVHPVQKQDGKEVRRKDNGPYVYTPDLEVIEET